MNKKLIIGIVILMLILISGYAVNKYFKENKFSEMPVANLNPEIKSNEILYADYLNEAIEYRMAGFQGDTEAFYKAIDSYKKAAEVFKGEKKAWVPYLNIGNTYRLLKDYNFAEEAYAKALEISPEESSIYLAKIEMYRYELNKSNSEIEEIYNEALEKATDNINVMISCAAFLRDMGNNQEALKYYKILSEKYPDNQSYKDEIEELKAK